MTNQYNNNNDNIPTPIPTDQSPPQPPPIPSQHFNPSRRHVYMSFYIPMFGTVNMDAEFETNTNHGENSIETPSNSTESNQESGFNRQEFLQMLPMFRIMNSIAQMAIFNQFAQQNGMDSEQLRAFMQGGGNKPAPPASQEVVECLPRVKINENSNNCQDSACTICQEEFTSGNTAIRLPCKHLFDSECITEWLKTSNKCPNCRYELLTDDEEYNKNVVLKQQALKHEEQQDVEMEQFDGCRLCQLHNGCELLSGDHSTVKLSDCNHVFHKECLNGSQRIFNSNYLNSEDETQLVSCPTCRKQSTMTSEQLRLHFNNNDINQLGNSIVTSPDDVDMSDTIDTNPTVENNVNATSSLDLELNKQLESLLEDLKRQVSAQKLDNTEITVGISGSHTKIEPTDSENADIKEPLILEADQCTNKRKREEAQATNHSVIVEDITGKEDNEI